MTAQDLLFRNVDVDPSDPVERWPVEAIATALERGSLQHWRRIAASIDVDPWGPVARDVLDVLGCSHIYGVGGLMQDLVAASRSRAEDRERQAVADELREHITRSGMTAAQFAQHLGTSASRLSTYLSSKVSPSATVLVRARAVSHRAAP